MGKATQASDPSILLALNGDSFAIFTATGLGHLAGVLPVEACAGSTAVFGASVSATLVKPGSNVAELQSLGFALLQHFLLGKFGVGVTACNEVLLRGGVGSIRILVPNGNSTMGKRLRSGERKTEEKES